MNFILPHSREALRECLNSLPKDRRYEVRVEEKKSKRSAEQNARYWVILTYISQQLADETGKKYSPEVWHEFMKAKFLGKDAIVINGEPVLVQKTTTKLKVLEFGDYMTQCEAFAIDNGVHFYESLKVEG